MIRNRWAVLTILLGLASGASAQEPPRAKYGTHDVFLVLVQVKPTKIGKISWDPADGKPDLRVIISNEGSGKTFISDVAKDTYFVKFDLKDPILEVAEGDILEILVFDEDLTDHDMAGLSRKSLTPGCWPRRSWT